MQTDKEPKRVYKKKEVVHRRLSRLEAEGGAEIGEEQAWVERGGRIGAGMRRARTAEGLDSR